MKGRQIAYLPEELAWIEARKEMVRRDLHAMFVARWGRSDVSFANFKGLCTRKRWKTGRNGCFVPGQTPANKGKPMPYNAKSAATQFKKGGLPHNTKYLGHERVNKDGYVEISVAERNPHTGYERRYVAKHVHLWVALNGPVPEGMCLKSRDGNRQNTDPSNWQLIERALLPSLNGGPWGGLVYDDAPAELKETVMLTARLRRAKRQVLTK